jgi:hypothetical protein
MGINPNKCLHLANNAAAIRQVVVPPAIVEANADEVVYEITFDLPDAGLGNNVVPPDPLLQGDEEEVDNGADKAAVANPVVATKGRATVPNTSLQECGWQPTIQCLCPKNAVSPTGGDTSAQECG